MKKSISTILLISGFLSAAYLASPNSLRGQAPPGPLRPPQTGSKTQEPAQAKEQTQQPQEKLTLSGSWKLNRDESDDPRKKLQEQRNTSRGGSSGGTYGGGRRGGGGFPGGGRGTYGGRRDTTSGQSEQDRTQMQELFRPAALLNIEQKEKEVDLADEQDRRRIFFTDGRKPQKSKDDKYQEIAARWEDGRLVSEEKGLRGGKITRSFEVDSESQQLYERVQFSDSRSDSAVVIRYVYDLVREKKQ